MSCLSCIPFSIKVDDNGTSKVSYLPTAHTCSNTLNLPRGPLVKKLPEENQLFNIYDLAFANEYFGLV